MAMPNMAGQRTVPEKEPQTVFVEEQQKVPDGEPRIAFREPCICVSMHEACSPSTCDEAANEMLRKLAKTEPCEESLREPTLKDVNCAAMRGCSTCGIIYAGLKTPLVRNHCPWILRVKEDEVHMIMRFNRGLVEIYAHEHENFRHDYWEFYTSQDSYYLASCRAFPQSVITTSTGSPESIACAAEWIEECNGHSFCGSQDPGPLPSRVIDLGPWDELDFKPYLLEPNGISANYVTLSHCWGTDTQVLKTTKNTLSHRRAGINISLLSQTFRDAIFITRSLKIRYLWIDSLCIIQDDSIDWQSESAKMASIYQNSLFTIAAAAPDSIGIFAPTSRLNQERSWEITPIYSLKQSEADASSLVAYAPLSASTTAEYYYPSRVVIKLTPDRGFCVAEFSPFPLSHLRLHCATKKSEYPPFLTLQRNSGVFVREYVELYHGEYIVEYMNNVMGASFSDLMSRAWAFQERLLSTRILHYTNSELIWECKSVARCQCNHFSTSYQARTLKGLFEQSTSSDTEFETLSEAWKKIIFQYSARNLTYSSDRLPALSGLAKRFQQSGQLEEYVAGLWSENLSELLTWSTFDRTVGKRAESYVAPTWSWASVIGTVCFFGQSENCTYPWKSVTVGRVLDVICIPAGLDPTGAVSAGRLTVYAEAIEVTVRVSARRNPSEQLLRRKASDSSLDSDSDKDFRISDSHPNPYELKILHRASGTEALFTSDTLSDFDMLTEEHDVTCLLWTRNTGPIDLYTLSTSAVDRDKRLESCLISQCLILRPFKGDDNTYTRIGLLALVERKDKDGFDIRETFTDVPLVDVWFQGAEKRTFVIV